MNEVKKIEKLSIGQKLKKIRELRGFSVLALAKISGVARTTIAQIEKGSSADNPGIRTMAALAEALKVPIEYFLDENKVVVTDIPGLPPDLVELVLKHDAIPYFEVAQWAYDAKLNPDDFKAIVEAVRKIVQK